MGRVKAKVIDKIPVRCGLRKYDAYINVEAAPDTLMTPNGLWGPVTIVLHLRLKPGEEGKDAWYAMHLDVDTAIRLICALAKACESIMPVMTARDILIDAIKKLYEGRWRGK